MSILNHWLINLYNVNVFSILNSVKLPPEVAVKEAFHIDEHINSLLSSKCAVKDLGESLYVLRRKCKMPEEQLHSKKV